MAKDDKQKLFNTSMDKVNQAETQYGKIGDTAASREQSTWDRGTEDYSGAFKGYSDYAGGAGLTPADADRIRGAYAKIGNSSLGGGGGGGGGAYNPLTGGSNYAGLSSAYANAYRPDYAESDTGFRKLSGAGGGFDQGQLDQIYGNTKRLSDIGQTGGITDEDKSNIMRQSMLDQEKTGGYSEQDKALVRAKSAASSPAYFSALKDNLQRQRGVTGNLAAGGAVDFKAARQAAQQQAQDRTGAEIGLQDTIRGGKERAGQFLSGQGMQLAGLRTANELAGARSAGDLGLNTQMGITANQQAGLKGLQESQTGLGQWGLGQAGGLDQFGLTKAGGLDQFDINKAGLDLQAQGINASSGAQSAALAQQAAGQQADAERWLQEYGNTQKQYGIGGLNDLYGTNLNAAGNYMNAGMNALNSKASTQSAMLGHGEVSRGTTAMENMQTIGNVAGSVAGAMTGLGGVGGLIGGATKGIQSAGAMTPNLAGLGSMQGSFGYQPQTRQPNYNFFGGGGG